MAPDSRFIEALTLHQPVLEAFCYAQVANRADARDVLQETNLRLWEKSADWDPESKFLPWAFAVARFTILSHVRDKMRDRLVFDPDVIELMAGDCEQSATELTARREALGHCLKKLDAEHRLVLRAYYIGGETLRAIAASRQRSESSLKMLMLRLRHQLGLCIQRQMAGNSL